MQKLTLYKEEYELFKNCIKKVWKNKVLSQKRQLASALTFRIDVIRYTYDKLKIYRKLKPLNTKIFNSY